MELVDKITLIYNALERRSKVPVYAKVVNTTDSRFAGRSTTIFGLSSIAGLQPAAQHHSIIPVPNNVVLCNGCNKNLYPEQGYLVYLDKRELQADRPYDIYCSACLKKLFPKYQIVEGS